MPVVGFVRSRYRLAKVGHGGTLDPMATGLLVLLLGKGTKCSEAVMNGEKVCHGEWDFKQSLRDCVEHNLTYLSLSCWASGGSKIVWFFSIWITHSVRKSSSETQMGQSIICTQAE